jgi:uncharacterized cupredoxin-like copper-binding protein
MMTFVELQEGQDAWIYCQGHTGNKSKGKVVKRIRIDGWDIDHYVIEFETGMDPVYEVRDGHMVSDTEHDPIGMWRNLRK